MFKVVQKWEFFVLYICIYVTHLVKIYNNNNNNNNKNLFLIESSVDYAWNLCVKVSKL